MLCNYDHKWPIVQQYMADLANYLALIAIIMSAKSPKLT